MFDDTKRSLDFLSEMYTLIEEGKAVISEINTEQEYGEISAFGSNATTYKPAGRKRITIYIDA